jgi:hypothetical protein
MAGIKYEVTLRTSTAESDFNNLSVFRIIFGQSTTCSAAISSLICVLTVFVSALGVKQLVRKKAVSKIKMFLKKVVDFIV